LSERAGLLLTALVSAANTHDAHLLVPLLDSLAPIRSRRGWRRNRPAKLHGDKAYNNQYIPADLRSRRIVARLARKGIESSVRLGRHRWVIERSLSWLMCYRRLVRRYDRLADHFQGFVTKPKAHLRADVAGQVVESVMADLPLVVRFDPICRA
jgi:transposase